MDDAKVIFLDIDGVLNHVEYGLDTYHDHFAEANIPLDKDNVDALEKLLNAEKDAKIVWSTDWRFCQDEKWDKWTNPRKVLETLPFMKDRIIGITPKKFSSEHFHEIHWWLKAHPNVTKYLILEDGYFPDEWFGLEKHLMRIDPTKGFTENNIQQAQEILNKEINDGNRARRD